MTKTIKLTIGVFRFESLATNEKLAKALSIEEGFGINIRTAREIHIRKVFNVYKILDRLYWNRCPNYTDVP